MADAIHKILVDKTTGKIQQPVHLIESKRPNPPDQIWIIIAPGTALYNHFSMDPPLDISHLDLDEIYWDFQGNAWVEVPTSKLPSFEAAKINRNEKLKVSDKIIADCTDPVEVSAWAKYRQDLRDLFVNIPEDFDWNMLVFPRDPTDIASLKAKAAAGDKEAADIITRDNL